MVLNEYSILLSEFKTVKVGALQKFGISFIVCNLGIKKYEKNSLPQLIKNIFWTVS